MRDPRTAPALLATDEPAPFTVLNSHSTRPWLLVCDHASARIPRALGDLGLDAATRTSHRAHDLGAAALVGRLSQSLNATAVLAGYSRLVVDANRGLHEAEAFIECSDGSIIPGNRRLDDAARQQRAEALYWPYHDAVQAQIRRLQDEGETPFLLSIHSFTPVFAGQARPWQAGVLWDADPRSAGFVIEQLQAAGLSVGDNLPYSGKSRAPQDFTIDYHAEAAGLPNVLIEIRHDLLASDAGIARMATLLHDIITRLPPALRTRLAPAGPRHAQRR